MGTGCEEDLVTLWEGVPPPPSTPPGPLAPHRWAPGPSHPHPRLLPAQSPPGWPAGPAQPAPPERRHSWGGWGPHCSAGPAAPHLPAPPLLRAGWPRALASGRPLTSRTGSCSGPWRAGPAQPPPPAARHAAPVASCHPCRSARAPGRTLGAGAGNVGLRRHGDCACFALGAAECPPR